MRGKRGRTKKCQTRPRERDQGRGGGKNNVTGIPGGKKRGMIQLGPRTRCANVPAWLTLKRRSRTESKRKKKNGREGGGVKERMVPGYEVSKVPEWGKEIFQRLLKRSGKGGFFRAKPEATPSRTLLH